MLLNTENEGRDVTGILIKTEQENLQQNTKSKGQQVSCEHLWEKQRKV